MQRLQHRQGLLGRFNSNPHFFDGPVVFVKVPVAVLKGLCDEVPQFSIVELDNNLTSNVLNLLVASVLPSTQFSYRLEVMGYGAPGFLSSL